MNVLNVLILVPTYKGLLVRVAGIAHPPREARGNRLEIEKAVHAVHAVVLEVIAVAGTHRSATSTHHHP